MKHSTDLETVHRAQPRSVKFLHSSKLAPAFRNSLRNISQSDMICSSYASHTSLPLHYIRCILSFVHALLSHALRASNI